MASNRHLGRIIALQTLYEQDFRRASDDDTLDLDAVLGRNIARYEATVDDKKFIEELVRGVAKREKELDDALQPVAPEWPIDQIARIDRIILRMGLYELRFNKSVPPKVVINEAVELAKAFGSENSSKFVNGVLGTVLRKIEEENGVVSAPKPAAKNSKEESSEVQMTPEEANEKTDKTSEKVPEKSKVKTSEPKA